MIKKIFINLPVENVEKPTKFYTELGFAINPEFTDDSQKCMIWSEHIYVMLQSQKMFRSYIKKQMPDIKKYQTSSYTLPVESFDRVNEIIESGLQAGGTEPTPMIDESFMQIRTIEDFDGHIWDVIYLDIEKDKQRTANKRFGNSKAGCYKVSVIAKLRTLAISITNNIRKNKFQQHEKYINNTSGCYRIFSFRVCS